MSLGASVPLKSGYIDTIELSFGEVFRVVGWTFDEPGGLFTLLVDDRPIELGGSSRVHRPDVVEAIGSTNHSLGFMVWYVLPRGSEMALRLIHDDQCIYSATATIPGRVLRD